MKRKASIVFLLLMLISTMLAGCDKLQTTMIGSGSNKPYPSIKDRSGTNVTLPESINKIISIGPSNTEILIALGLGDNIITTDDYSTRVDDLEEAKTHIDFKNPDTEIMLGLKPDIIIASAHYISGDKDPFKRIKEAGISVVYIPSSESIENIYDDIAFIADITGTEEKGKEIIDNMKNEIDKIKKIGKTITNKKTVYFEIAAEPTIYSFGKGTFLHEMIELIGAKNIFEDQAGWTQIKVEEVLKANPDVIMTNVDYIEDPIEDIKGREGWNSLKAVVNNQVYSIDSKSSLHPSQNIIKALKEMSKAVYPDKYE